MTLSQQGTLHRFNRKLRIPLFNPAWKFLLDVWWFDWSNWDNHRVIPYLRKGGVKWDMKLPSWALKKAKPSWIASIGKMLKEEVSRGRIFLTPSPSSSFYCFDIFRMMRYCNRLMKVQLRYCSLPKLCAFSDWWIPQTKIGWNSFWYAWILCWWTDWRGYLGSETNLYTGLFIDILKRRKHDFYPVQIIHLSHGVGQKRNSFLEKHNKSTNTNWSNSLLCGHRLFPSWKGEKWRTYWGSRKIGDS